MIGRVLEALRRIAQRERLADWLHALDDRELKDLGLARDQICVRIRADEDAPRRRR